MASGNSFGNVDSDCGKSINSFGWFPVIYIAHLGQRMCVILWLNVLYRFYQDQNFVSCKTLTFTDLEYVAWATTLNSPYMVYNPVFCNEVFNGLFVCIYRIVLNNFHINLEVLSTVRVKMKATWKFLTVQFQMSSFYYGRLYLLL